MADQPWQWAMLPTGTTLSTLGRPPKPPLADPKQQAKREAATAKKQRQRAAAKEKEKQRVLSHLYTDTFRSDEAVAPHTVQAFGNLQSGMSIDLSWTSIKTTLDVDLQAAAEAEKEAAEAAGKEAAAEKAAAEKAAAEEAARLKAAAELEAKIKAAVEKAAVAAIETAIKAAAEAVAAERVEDVVGSDVPEASESESDDVLEAEEEGEGEASESDTDDVIEASWKGWVVAMKLLKKERHAERKRCCVESESDGDESVLEAEDSEDCEDCED